jgi:hypothetical protein
MRHRKSKKKLEGAVTILEAIIEYCLISKVAVVVMMMNYVKWCEMTEYRNVEREKIQNKYILLVNLLQVV